MTISPPLMQQKPFDFGGPVDGNFTPFDRRWRDRGAYAAFDEAARTFADRIAIDDGERQLTYGKCRALALGLAARLRAHLAPGDTVGIGLPSNALNPVAMLGCLAAGIAYVPLDIDMPGARNRGIIEDAGLKAIIVDDATAPLFEGDAPHVERVLFSETSAVDGAGQVDWERVGPSDNAFITYTSGSTGRPKGIVFPNKFVVASAEAQINALHLQPDDKVAQLFSPTVARSTQVIYGTLFAGATLRIINIKKQGLLEIARAAENEHLTIIESVPHVIRRLLARETAGTSFGSLRIVSIGGDRLFSSDVEQFRARLPAGCYIYLEIGSSESAKYAHRFIGHDTPIESGGLAVGWPVAGRRVTIVGADGNELLPGEIGEIVITSDAMANGYWRNPELTQASFSEVENDLGVRRFRVGDLGRFREDGQLEYFGRRDRMVKVNGNRVELEEVEAVVRAHPGVLDAAVIARRTGADTALIVYLVERKDAPPAPPLKEWLAERLPAPMLPAEIRTLSELPTLPSLKPDLLTLEMLDLQSAQAANETPKAEGQAPLLGASVAETIRNVWTDLLDEEGWEKDLSWREAGGDSLNGLELVMHLEILLNRRLPVELLLPQTRPSELVSRMQELMDEEAAAPQDKSAADTRPIVFFLAGAAGPTMDQACLALELTDAYDVRILDYPEPDPSAPRIISFEEAVEKITTDIAEAQDPSRPLWLLGYSYGGYVAAELAERAIAAGQEVAFLGIIDSYPLPRSGTTKRRYNPDDDLGSQFIEAARAGWAKKFVLITLLRLYMRMSYGLISGGWFAPIAWFASYLKRRGHTKALAAFWWHFKYMAHRASVRDHLPGYFPGKIWLFRTENNPKYPQPEDYCWRDHADQVEIIWVKGRHEAIFAQRNLPSLIQLLRNGLDTVRVTDRTEAPVIDISDRLKTKMARTA